MSLKTLQFKILTIFCIVALLWNSYLLITWYMGENVSPSLLMNSLIVLAYSICFVGFNWPNSKRLSYVRWFGMIYSLIMLIISLLMANDVIGFEASWNYIIGGLTLSLALSGIFQIYRVSYESTNSIQKAYKFILMLVTIIVFTGLGAIYLVIPEEKSFYRAFEIVLTIYSTMVMLYFVWMMFTTTADKSMRK